MEKVETQSVTVAEDQADLRLDKMLAAAFPDLSRARLQALIKEEMVTVNGAIIKTASRKVSMGEIICVKIPPAAPAEPEPENIPLNILYEDDDLLVIDKPAGLVVHPGAGNPNGTLVNALLAHCGDSLSGIGGVKRPGIVHRLDKETSGLILVAKNDYAHHHLSDQLQDRSLSRKYIAYVWNKPRLIKGTVSEPIGRHATQRLKMAVMKKSGKAATTHYRLVEAYGNHLAKIECVLESGRTHQIRVHMQFIGHSLIGDPLYGLPLQEGQAKLKNAMDDAVRDNILHFQRQALHAYQIAFRHPANEGEMSFESPLPEDLRYLENSIKTAH
jgi:23S rRNA pseudouridine1911/1915/1917 synthase